MRDSLKNERVRNSSESPPQTETAMEHSLYANSAARPSLMKSIVQIRGHLLHVTITRSSHMRVEIARQDEEEVKKKMLESSLSQAAFPFIVYNNDFLGVHLTRYSPCATRTSAGEKARRAARRHFRSAPAYDNTYLNVRGIGCACTHSYPPADRENDNISREM